jgi:hypothetical protein
MESDDNLVLQQIKAKIETMDKYQQIEILKILSNHQCKLNENKSGVFVNMSFLDKLTIDELNAYIEYIQQQEESLKTSECQKKEYQNSFFVENHNKDETIIQYSNK